jgi:hypothetical protein
MKKDEKYSIFLVYFNIVKVIFYISLYSLFSARFFRNRPDSFRRHSRRRRLRRRRDGHDRRNVDPPLHPPLQLQHTKNQRSEDEGNSKELELKGKA